MGRLRPEKEAHTTQIAAGQARPDPTCPMDAHGPVMALISLLSLSGYLGAGTVLSYFPVCFHCLRTGGMKKYKTLLILNNGNNLSVHHQMNG